MRKISEASKTKIFITLIVALGGAVAPATAWVSKRKEIELERTKQKHEQDVQNREQAHKMRMDFLEKVISFESKPGDNYYRRDVLKFFASTLEEGSLKDWAKEQLLATQKAIDEIEEYKSKLKSAHNALLSLAQEKEDIVRRLSRNIEGMRRRGNESQKQLLETKDRLEQQLDDKEEDLARQRRDVAALQARVEALGKPVGANASPGARPVNNSSRAGMGPVSPIEPPDR